MFNQDQFEGKWTQMKAGLRQQFGNLTNDDVKQISGKRDKLIGKLRERYGDSQEQAEKRLNHYESTL